MAVNETLRVAKTLRYDADHYSLYLTAGTIGPKTQPGHFAMVAAGDALRPYLRRAFSIADVATLGGVPVIELVIKVVGVGTSSLSRFSAGTPLQVLGPLGVPFPIDDLSRGDRVALVSGGIGLAPLVLLSRRLSERGITADLFYGGRNERDVLKRPDFERFLTAPRCRYATDDGSLGRKGLVTDLLLESLEDVSYRRLFACGPLPMLRALATITRERGLDASFAMESEMACGFGVCLGCVVPTQQGRYATLCHEGPCVPPSFVDWSRI